MKKTIWIALVILIILSSCVVPGNSAGETTNANEPVANTSKDYEQDTTAARQVVEDHFKFLEQKDQEGVLSTLADWYKQSNIDFKFENQESIKVISIDLETDTKYAATYLKNGRGTVTGVSTLDLRVFRVIYDVEYKDDSIGVMPSGRYTWRFFVIRQNEQGPWLIDDYGV
ncbi:DUF4829 domain-containing protein [Oscillospiraceae bacterium CM]|nr:DUF4829 domain-containing protein [Oscillospiraceae bacterium CM]